MIWINLIFLLLPTFRLIDSKPLRPNIVYILADDLGYGELGVYGQEKIETPNIDALAKQGMLFTQHYSGAPVCAPARNTLLAGLHTGHTTVRGNDAMAHRGDVWSLEAMTNDPNLEGQSPVGEAVYLLPQLLKDQGYRTGMVGKWGLGGPMTNSTPNKKGFDFFYGYNCQRVAHTYYPPFLWKNEERIYLKNKLVPLHANLTEGADPDSPESYSDFKLNEYAPDLMHQEALQFIRDNKEQPFFLYYASPVPHVPLQAPERWVQYYQTKFGAEKPSNKNGYYPNRTPHATYAAMISYLDEQVGELIAELKKQGVYQNTLIIFSSDNGPTYTGGADQAYFESAKPFVSEFGRSKGFVYEGGIRVPMIAVWENKIRANSKTELISSFVDVMPTVAQILDVDLMQNTDGISFLPTLLGKGKQVKHPYLYWEFPENGGMQALRMGNWKAVRKDIKKGNLHIELYDLNKDIQERNDLSAANQDLITQIEAIFKKEHETPENNTFIMSALD